MITLPSHTSHAFQLLGVVCFKTFKTAIKRGKYTTIFSRNYIEPDKMALVGWVDKVLDHALIRKNIMSRFKGTWI
jgi:hypothetical protein